MMLKDASHDVKEVLQESIRNDHPDDTNIYIDRILSITEAISLLQFTDSKLREINSLISHYKNS